MTASCYQLESRSEISERDFYLSPLRVGQPQQRGRPAIDE
jgi:hypothetical protein